MYEAKIIADSICSRGKNQYRLTTMQLTHPRIVHAEFMTHCMFARNAASSRAIPFTRFLEAVQKDPFIPVYWGKNQAGMQARFEFDPEMIDLLTRRWLRARDEAVNRAAELHQIGVHKQIANRLLEPWSWITVCVTGDKNAWSNYFAQRCHEDAQPEIQKQAFLARDAYLGSKPTELKLGEWHLPYLSTCEKERVTSEMAMLVSIARCARVSYLNQQGTRDLTKDVELAQKLLCARPMHASPFEHAAEATALTHTQGKFPGWAQLRHRIYGERTLDYFERLK